ncbi:MAG TPA: hypothetical protein VNX21_03420, partial [Candidatus Thermoplasmatota archaeon]|nr:hypothetical protein [Candidatus Thermoplasmatota archaeon]
MTAMDGAEEPHLRVYANRSELHRPGFPPIVFHEGLQSDEARQNYVRLVAALRGRFLENEISMCESQGPASRDQLDRGDRALIERIAASATSQYGRAVIGLCVLQLTVKAIVPAQTIRLHKSSTRKGTFSWRDGLPMRVLDADYITPALRAHGILRLNADGVFMTRTLAENYPYSQVYKAEVRGARKDWLALVEKLEDGSIPPLHA